jgi:hypothetical protein
MEPGYNIEVNKYLTWIREGRSFSDVRDDMRSSGLPDDDIRDFIDSLNKAFITNSIGQERNFHSRQWKLVGKVMLIIGAGAIILFAFIRLFYILGFGLTFLSAGIASLRMSERLNGNNNSFFKRPMKRKINLRRH